MKKYAITVLPGAPVMATAAAERESAFSIRHSPHKSGNHVADGEYSFSLRRCLHAGTVEEHLISVAVLYWSKNAFLHENDH